MAGQQLRQNTYQHHRKLASQCIYKHKVVMHCVYRLQSLAHPNRHYTGYTTDLKARLTHHNTSCCDHTKAYKPWKLIWYSAYESEQKARDFERYLKTASGKAFANKRLW